MIALYDDFLQFRADPGSVDMPINSLVRQPIFSK
jgi:hypothetical protein